MPQGNNRSRLGRQRSIEQKKLKHLTVHDVGLVVFNETHSYSDRPESNEPVTSARQKLAHVVMNGDQKYGPDRQKHASTALPIEPSNEVLDNKSSHAAYDSSMKAAREAYLDGNDPTDGALYSIQRDTPDRSNYHFKNGSAQGVRLRTQSGPYNNAFPNKLVPSRRVWVNTYSEA